MYICIGNNIFNCVLPFHFKPTWAWESGFGTPLPQNQASIQNLEQVEGRACWHFTGGKYLSNHMFNVCLRAKAMGQGVGELKTNLMSQLDQSWNQVMPATSRLEFPSWFCRLGFWKLCACPPINIMVRLGYLLLPVVACNLVSLIKLPGSQITWAR